MATPAPELFSNEAPALEGVWTAALTPMKADLRPDAARLARHIAWLYQNGSHGTVLFGTTGEATSFSLGERRGLLDEMAKHDFDFSRVIVGTGQTSYPDAAELTRHAIELGARAVLLAPPFYYKQVSDDGLFAFISRMLESAGADETRLVLYHFPKMAGLGYSIPLVHRLMEAWPDAIVGIKDSTGDTDHLTQFCRELEGISVFAGSEALLSYGLDEGGAGCISATANVTSRLVRAVFDGDKAAADRMIRTRKALEALPLVPALKRILADSLDEPAWRAIRPPLMPLTPAMESRLEEILDTVGVLPNFVKDEDGK
jgi:4-hydroxy-tetrahydrodipicolinate synthase